MHICERRATARPARRRHPLRIGAPPRVRSCGLALITSLSGHVLPDLHTVRGRRGVSLLEDAGTPACELAVVSGRYLLAVDQDGLSANHRLEQVGSNLSTLDKRFLDVKVERDLDLIGGFVDLELLQVDLDARLVGARHLQLGALHHPHLRSRRLRPEP